MAECEQTLDAKGLTCPLPLLKARQCMAGMAPGDVLHVEATDPGSWRDFESYAVQVGHELRRQEVRDGVYFFSLVKGGER